VDRYILFFERSLFDKGFYVELLLYPHSEPDQYSLHWHEAGLPDALNQNLEDDGRVATRVLEHRVEGEGERLLLYPYSEPDQQFTLLA